MFCILDHTCNWNFVIKQTHYGILYRYWFLFNLIFFPCRSSFWISFLPTQIGHTGFQLIDRILCAGWLKRIDAENLEPLFSQCDKEQHWSRASNHRYGKNLGCFCSSCFPSLLICWKKGANTQRRQTAELFLTKFFMPTCLARYRYWWSLSKISQ